MLAAPIVLAALIPIVLFAWVTVDRRQEALVDAAHSQQRLVEALAQHTRRLLTTHEVVLNIADQAAAEKSCDQMRTDASLQGFVQLLAREATLTRAIWIIDADGFLCMSSSPRLLDDKSRADRDYFVLARKAGPGGFAVGHATTGRIDGQPIFNFAKARTKNGAFNGVVLASPGLEELLDHWRKEVAFSPSERIELLSDEGGTIARSWPPLVPDGAPPSRGTDRPWSTQETGVETVASPADDNLDRITAWQRLPKWGVVVTGSVRQVDALAPWRRSTFEFAPFVLMGAIVLGALTWQLLRGQHILARRVDQRTRELMDNEARFGALVDAMPQLAFVMRPDGSTELLNRRWADFADLPPDGDWTALVHPDEHAAVRTTLAQARHEGGSASFEHRLRDRQGRYRWFLTQLRPQVSAGAAWPIRWLGTSTDISDLVAAKEALSRSHDELESVVAERTRDLRETQTQLAHSQRVEALGQLTGGIAHDFNNILQAFHGGAGLILRHAADTKRIAGIAEMLRDTADRGSAITRRLLTIARRGELRPEPIDPCALLDDMRQFLSHTLGSGVMIRTQAPPTLPRLLADRGQLETVLINLATNARDAMNGAGSLTLGAASQLVLDDGPIGPYGSVLRAGAYVCLTVEDTGAGMSAEILARACEPFFTTKASGEGTGLGLAIARGFLEQSGGGMQIESEVGHGTIVRLWLPVAEAAALQDAEAGAPPADRIAGLRRILLVDDEPSVRETLREELQALGPTVVAAGDGQEALALLEREEPFDVLITDLSMPRMDGLQLIQAAQQRQATLPAILLTGFVTSAAELAIGGAVSGTFTLLQKPVRIATLVERANVLLEAKTAGTRSRV